MSEIEDMKKESIRRIGEIIRQSDQKPVFADDIIVSPRMKVSTDEKGNVKSKEIVVSFHFIDSVNQKHLGEFVINLSTLINLAKILPDNIKAIEKEMGSKELPKMPKGPSMPSATYIR